MDRHPIEVASELLGGYEALALQLGVTKGAVHQWKAEGRRTPAEHCPKIERLCNGAVRCEELNDRVDWAFIRSHPAAAEPAKEDA